MSLCKANVGGLFSLNIIINWNGEGCAKGHFLAPKIIPRVNFCYP